MRIGKSFLLLASVVLYSGVALADHCDFAPDVRWATHELDSAARHFHRVIHNVTGYSHLASDVHELAEEAQHLHRSAHETASCGHIQSDFRQLQSAYTHVQRMLYRAHQAHHNPHVMHDWYDVEDAYYEVQWAVSGRGGHGGGHGGWNEYDGDEPQDSGDALIAEGSGEL